MNNQQEDPFSRRVPAGKRTYFFDVKTTKSGKDFFLVITESKRVGEREYEKHRIFLYKEDFEKFFDAFGEATEFINEKLGEVGSGQKV